MSDPITTVQGNKKVQTAWAFYDWANSVYNLVITATIFPMYFKAVTETKNEAGDVIDNTVQFLGFQLKNTTLYDFALSFAYFVIVLIAPLLSGIADYGGYKKRFMQFFTYLGALSCIGLFFFDRDTLWLGILLSILACIGYSGSLVFYNAFLPEVAFPEQQDKLSAKGFALGYLGSSLLLIVNLVMVLKPELFGFTDSGEAIRIAFLTVGLWWILFAQIPFYHLPGNLYGHKPSGNRLSKGYRELQKVWRELKHTPRLKRFLLAFFMYSMGVQTVMLVANHFGSEEIKMEPGQLITTILIIQFVAIAGAFLFSYSSSRIGNVKTLRLATLVWALICISTFFFVHTPTHFYVVAGAVGLVMGGIQALSRSTYSKLLPPTQDHASYFSFYDVCEKLSIVLGMGLFGLINELSMSMREPIILLIVFFIAGYLLLLRVSSVTRS